MRAKTVSLFAGAGCLAAACIWGFAFVVVKDSLSYVSAIYMMAFRFTIAAAGLALVFVKKLPLLNARYWKNGFVLGVCLFGAYAFQTVGCNFTTPGKNAFLTTIYVILVPLFGWPLYQKRPAWYVFAAAVMQLVGIGFLSLGTDADSWLRLNIGDALTLVCGVFYAAHIICQEKYNKGADASDPILLTVLQFFFAAVFSWISAPFYNMETSRFTAVLQPFPAVAVRDARVVVSMLYLGLLSTLLAFCLQNVGLKYVRSSVAALLLSFESVFGMLFSVLIPVNGARETLSAKGVVGCVLIFTAVILAETRFDFLPILRKDAAETPCSG